MRQIQPVVRTMFDMILIAMLLKRRYYPGASWQPLMIAAGACVAGFFVVAIITTRIVTSERMQYSGE